MGIIPMIPIMMHRRHRRVIRAIRGVRRHRRRFAPVLPRRPPILTLDGTGVYGVRIPDNDRACVVRNPGGNRECTVRLAPDRASAPPPAGSRA